MTDKTEEKIIYIGCSGHIENGKSICRNGGLKRRIYGKQNGIPRDQFWKNEMKRLEIKQLKVYWFNTEQDDPEFIEYKLLLRFIIHFHTLPKYNKKLERKERWGEDGFLEKSRSAGGTLM